MACYNVLIADDDPDNYELALSAFYKLSVKNNLFYVKNGEDLIVFLRRTILLKSDLPDIILLDIDMPKMNGLDALRVIKAHKQLCSIPVILYTSSVCEEKRKKGISYGANGFVIKHNSYKGIISFISEVQGFLDKQTDLPGKIQ